jgi:putative membrane protein
MFGWDMHDWEWGGMHMGPGWLWLILAIVLVVLLVAMLVRMVQGGLTQGGPPQGPPPPDAGAEADRILKTRLARGDISREEYEETRRTLGLQ